MARSQKEPGILEIEDIQAGEVTIYVLGLSPLIFNRMALKARQELLMPRGRMTAAQKATNLKHDPLEEFRNSVNRRRDDESGPTRLIFPAPAFKGAMATAALDIPSVTKSRINRLTWINGQTVDIYGKPEMLMSVVRSADQNKTPDIRTRAILPEWASVVTVRYVMPLIGAQVIASLMGASGLIVGIGDFRQEKGKGSHGQFLIVPEDDPQLRRIMQTGGREVQDAAMENPEYHDIDTEDLFEWFKQELPKRNASREEAAAARLAKLAAKESGNGRIRRTKGPAALDA